MGYDRHHGILVTTFTPEYAAEAHAKATALGMSVTPILTSRVNARHSFAVLPDGSQEGWDQSDDGDRERDAFVEWLDEQRYGDGSSPFAWVEVQYGDERGDTRIIRHGDEPERRIPGQRQPG